MTVVFTAVSPRLVVMAVDSAVRLDFTETREYETGRKLWWFTGLGGVSAWGARDGNTIGRYVAPAWAELEGRTVDDLARDVHRFLVSDYAPDQRNAPDAGFHVAGFTPAGEPRLFHSFWNGPRDGDSRGAYTLQLATPPNSSTALYYNGRHDLAERMIGALLEDLKEGRDTRFNHRTPGGLVYLAHMALRFASEVSMEVGPPFVIRALTADGNEVSFRFDDLQRRDLEYFETACVKLASSFAQTT